MDTKENSVNLIQDVDYIKLTKNSRGYTWDIKVIGHDVEKIKAINAQLEEAFPSVANIRIPDSE